MPARSFALSHALKGLCLSLSAFVTVSLAVLAPTPAGAAETVAKPATSTSLTTPYTRVASGSHPTLTMAVKRSDGSAADGTVQLFYRPSVSVPWTTGSALQTSNGLARFTYTASRGLYFRAVFNETATAARSESQVLTVTVAPSFGTRVIQEAARHKGAPYVYGAAGPTRFDCSGYTRYVFGRFGKSLPHNSAQQYSVVRHISKSSMRVGDLLFFYTGGIHHVGIYAGNGNMWHAPHSGDVVKLAKIYSSAYYVGRVG